MTESTNRYCDINECIETKFNKQKRWLRRAHKKRKLFLSKMLSFMKSLRLSLKENEAVIYIVRWGKEDWTQF